MKQAPTCQEPRLHPDRVEKATLAMPSEDVLFPLADLYKIFGDSTRLRILFALFESELCVCDLAKTCGLTVSAVSHQLRILKQADLVRCRRDGKAIFYSLADGHVQTIMEQGIEHVCE